MITTRGWGSALVTTFGWGGVVVPTPWGQPIYASGGGGGGAGRDDTDLFDAEHLLCFDEQGNPVPCGPELRVIRGGRVDEPPLPPVVDADFVRGYTTALHERIMLNVEDQSLTASWLEWRERVVPHLTTAEQARHLLKFEQAYAQESRNRKVRRVLGWAGIGFTLWRILK